MGRLAHYIAHLPLKEMAQCAKLRRTFRAFGSGIARASLPDAASPRLALTLTNMKRP